MTRIVGIYFRGRKFLAENIHEGHKEVAERVCSKYKLLCPKGDPVDFLIEKGALKIGNRYGNSKIIVFKGGCLDNDTAKMVEHYMCYDWEIIDLDQEVNWQF